MSYCRFRNTLNDLEDCVYALEDINLEDLSQEELWAAKRMRHLCEEYIELFDSVERGEDEY
jgi:hypothetical protein